MVDATDAQAEIDKIVGDKDGPYWAADGSRQPQAGTTLGASPRGDGLYLILEEKAGLRSSAFCTLCRLPSGDARSRMTRHDRHAEVAVGYTIRR